MEKIVKRYFSSDKPTTKYIVGSGITRVVKLTASGEVLSATDPKIYESTNSTPVNDQAQSKTLISVNVVDRLLTETSTSGFEAPYVGKGWKKLLDADYFNLNKDDCITLCISWKNPMSPDATKAYLYPKNIVVFDNFLPIFATGIDPYQGREGSILVSVPRSGRSIQVLTTDQGTVKMTNPELGGEFYLVDQQIDRNHSEKLFLALSNKYSDGSSFDLDDARYQNLYPQWLKNYNDNKSKGLFK